MSFEDNTGNKGDLPLVAYIDFETTAENFLTPEQNKMSVVSYTLIFAFHPKPNLNVELKFASNFLLKWFNRKFKIQNMEIDQKEKVTYEAFNPIEQQKTKCVICNFPLIINVKGSSVPANEMSYTDFFEKNILKRRVRNVKGAEKSRVLL